MNTDAVLPTGLLFILAVTRPASWYTRLTRGRVVLRSLNARYAVVFTRGIVAVQSCYSSGYPRLPALQ